MKPTRRILFLALALALALAAPLAARAMIVDDGTTCPSDASGWHNWQWVSTQQPTCQHGIIETYRCGNCGKTYTSEYGQLAGHQFVEEGRAPTCTEGGFAQIRCTVCGATSRRIDYPALGHDPETTRGKAATCTEAGYTESSKCSRCGAVLRASSAIPALGHDWGGWWTSTEATCTKGGREMRVCDRCEAEQYRDTAALGHSWGSWKTSKAATCTAEGTRARACTRCGKTETQTIPKTDHSPVSVPGKPATCTDAGISEGSKCSKCGAVLKAQQTLPATGHNWGPWKVEYPGTCVERGMNVRKCASCGKEEYVYSDYGDHDWGEWETAAAPTAADPGLEKRICKNDPSHVEEREIPPTGEPAGVLHPGALYQVSPAEGESAGVGKRYEGATIPFHYMIANTGNCPIYVIDRVEGQNGIYGISKPGNPADRLIIDTPMLLLYPGESVSYSFDYPVSAKEAEEGKIEFEGQNVYFWDEPDGTTPEGWLKCEKFTVILTTAPEGVETAPWIEISFVSPVSARYTYDNVCIAEDIHYETNYLMRYDLLTAYHIDGNWKSCAWRGYDDVFEPGESSDDVLFTTNVNDNFKSHINPGTETETLAGTVTVFFRADGINVLTGEKVCESNVITRTYNVAKPKDDGPHPALYLEFDWDESVGEGKRYVGAIIPRRETITNTGDCTVYVDRSHYVDPNLRDFDYPSGDAYVPELELTLTAIQPGESWACTFDRKVYEDEVEQGYLTGANWEYAYYLDSDGKAVEVYSNHVSIDIPLTYPEDDGPHPALHLEFDWDESVGEGKRYVGAIIPRRQTITNTGDCTVYVDRSRYTAPSLIDFVYPDGDAYVPELGLTLTAVQPGESWAYTYNRKVYEDEVEQGYLTGAGWEYAYYLDSDGKAVEVYSNHVSIDIPLTYPKDDGPHPALQLECTWAPDAGEGKRYEDAIVPIQYKTTNTGDCPLYVNHDDIPSDYTDFVYPGGMTYIEAFGKAMYVINPGESWTYTWNISVFSYEAEQGFIDFNTHDAADYIDAEGNVDRVKSNMVHVNIPLTYPDGATPEEDKPALKLTVVQTTPEKEAYADTYEIISENEITYNLTVTNTGNVPLRFNVYMYEGATEHLHISGFVEDFILNPGESWNAPWFWHRITNRYGYTPPDSTDSPYMASYPLRYKVFGYAADDTYRTTPICESNPVDFTYNIYKPGLTPWPIPEESQMKLEIIPLNTLPDPAGYQLGEYWAAYIKLTNPGTVDAIDPNMHIDHEITDIRYPTAWPKTDGPTWVEYQIWPVCAPSFEFGLFVYGQITEEDVQRGYVEISGYVKWTDPDSGKERTVYSNIWNVPVISKTGLVLTKTAGDPPNGEYYKPGEKVSWTLDVTNNSKEPIKNVTVTDNGTVVATFAEIAAGETKHCAVPPTIVTDYDAQVTGYVINTAKATGADLKGAAHTWYSNPAKAVCKDPDTPTILGANPGLTAVKTDLGPVNMSYYRENEEITFNVTVTNTGDCELNNLEFYDSLAGFAPVDTLASLPVAGSHTFTYKYTVKEADMSHPTLTNSATIKYTFLGNPGTPVTCKDTVKIGDGSTIIEGGDPPFDPEILKGGSSGGDDFCTLTLETLGTNEARYTLHACAAHSTAAAEAENAGLAGDWKQAAGIWQAEIDKLYETLYAAANDEAKGALLEEKLQFENETGNLAALYGDRALAEALRMKCAELCCVMRTASQTLPSSLTGGNSALMTKAGNAETTARVFGSLQGSDCEVTDTFAGSSAYVLETTMDLLHSARSYDFGDVFLRAQTLWQGALDQSVNAAYTAADREARKQIVLWRTSLDSLLSAERPFLELLYPDNRAMTEELLMDIYKDAGFLK